MQKLYLINNNDNNDNSMKLKDGEYYFSVWGKKKMVLILKQIVNLF